MTRALGADERARFEERGYLAPLRVLSDEAVDACRGRVEQRVAEIDDPDALRTKAHLQIPALMELVHLPAVVDPICDLLGADVLCRSATVFLKEPQAPSFVAWHQDAAYWNLDPPDVATAWIALTDSTTENGALRVLPGSHRAPLLAHTPIGDPDNMLFHRQAITDPIDEHRAVTVTLDAGEMSIHHVRIAHSSGPNRSRERRIGFAIRYVAAHVRKSGPRRDSALVVRGVDRYGNFDPEPIA